MASLGDIGTQAKLRVERARARHDLVDVVVTTFKRYSTDDGGFYAASLTYYMFFAIFPMLLFAASAIGYLSFLSLETQEDLLRAGLEGAPLVKDILKPRVLEILKNNRGTLAIIGFVTGLYAGSGGIVAFEHALNRINRVEHEPGFGPKRLRSLKWLGVLALAAVTSIALGAAAEFPREVIGDAAATRALGSVLGRAAGLAVGTAVFATAFKFLTAKDLSWRAVLPGAVAAAVVFELLKVGGAFVVEQGAAGRSRTFGAFATAAGLLVASYLLAQVTLLAAELNAVLAERRTTRQSAMVDERREVR